MLSMNHLRNSKKVASNDLYIACLITSSEQKKKKSLGVNIYNWLHFELLIYCHKIVAHSSIKLIFDQKQHYFDFCCLDN